MRKTKFTIFIMLIMVGCLTFLATCGTNEPIVTEENTITLYDEVDIWLLSIENYKAEATVRYISNKGINEYVTLQHGTITGEYRIEVIAPENVEGNITISDGNYINQFNKNIDGKISVGVDETKERTQILFSTFLINYKNAENVTKNTENIDRNQVIILELPVSGYHPYIAYQKLFIDSKNFEPIKLSVHDQNGNETIVVTYNDFEYNISLDDSLFITNY